MDLSQFSTKERFVCSDCWLKNLAVERAYCWMGVFYFFFYPATLKPLAYSRILSGEPTWRKYGSVWVPKKESIAVWRNLSSEGSTDLWFKHRADHCFHFAGERELSRRNKCMKVDVMCSIKQRREVNHIWRISRQMSKCKGKRQKERLQFYDFKVVLWRGERILLIILREPEGLTWSQKEGEGCDINKTKQLPLLPCGGKARGAWDRAKREGG